MFPESKIFLDFRRVKISWIPGTYTLLIKRWNILKYNLHVSNSTVWELEYELKTELIRAQEFGVPGFRQNKNQAVSGKGDLAGKKAIFGGFFWNIPQKFETFSVDVFKTLFKTNLIQVMTFLNSKFSKNIQSVTLWLSNRCFFGQKWRENVYWECCLQISTLIFKELPHSLIEPIRLQEEVCTKIGSSEFSVTNKTKQQTHTSYTILFCPWKRTKLYLFREIVFFLQSPMAISISTFLNLYLHSFVRLDRSTWIWAIVDNTSILAITVPFGWGMGQKHNKIVGKVLPELR